MMHFELIGTDGLDLLHRISTVDIRGLSPETWTDAFFCSPTGKIQSYFKIQKFPPDRLLISLDPGKDSWNLNQFKAILDHYTFSEQYTLQPISANFPTLPNISTESRIEKLIPAIDFEIPGADLVSPLDIGLKHAISDQKGCYPGQEVIEKIISIGSAPKKLVRLDLIGNTEEQTKSEARTFPAPLTTIDQKNSKALAIFRKTDAIIGRMFQDSESRLWKLSKVAGEE